MENIQTRLTQIDAIADNDEIYQVWRNSRDSFREDFQAFANSQPEETRNMLWGYADSGEMMHQRKLILACTHMSFTK